MNPHSFREDLGSIYHCDIILTSSEDGYLQKPINDHKDAFIVVFGGRKARHVIHGAGFPMPLGGRKRGV
jgi:hypothetical protein